MYGKFQCGHSKKPSNRMPRGDGLGCGYGCKICKSASNLKWRRAHPEWYLHESRKLKRQRVEPLLKGQKGRCAICRRKMKFPYEDHSHKCCPVGTSGCSKCRRGLLCPSCNAALHLLENRNLFKAAIAYLKKWETRRINGIDSELRITHVWGR